MKTDQAILAKLASIDRRLKAVEKVAHVPFDFSHLVERLEHLEAVAEQAARPSEGPAGAAGGEADDARREAEQ
jgi:hypothetical protein